MAAIDQTKNTSFDLCWARGDDDPRIFTITDSTGAAVDISTWTLSMAVNTDQNPPDTATQIFVVAGTLPGGGTDGRVQFAPPATSLDAVTAPGTAFYEVNRLTPSIKTILKGKVSFVMDIDKT